MSYDFFATEFLEKTANATLPAGSHFPIGHENHDIGRGFADTHPNITPDHPQHEGLLRSYADNHYAKLRENQSYGKGIVGKATRFLSGPYGQALGTASMLIPGAMSAAMMAKEMGRSDDPSAR
jgi:hypothetical protein